MNKANTNRQSAARRGGVSRLTTVMVLAAGALSWGGYWWVGQSQRRENPLQAALTMTVQQAEFRRAVTESGDVESSSNIEIRCQVKSQGRAGAVILSVIPEGTAVKAGDFLCQLDDSVLVDQLVQQRIQVAKDRAAKIQAERDLSTAQQILDEFRNGVYEQQKAALESEAAVANESLRRAKDTLAFSERLNRKGFVTRTQLEADVFALEKAQLDLALAQQKLQVYSQFTLRRTISEYEAEIEKQKANLEAANFTLELSQSRVKDIEDQIAYCRITAPRDGTLVYANLVDRRGDTSFVIEEGAVLRDGQPIFYLPDPTQMQVKAAVNDSKINLVQVGQPVTIRLDSAPDVPIQGQVSKVAPFPLPRRWFQAPIEYEVLVQITETSDLVRSGLRAKVEIQVDRRDSVLQTPVASILVEQDRQFVLVKNGNLVEPRPIVTGPNNEQFAVVEDGLLAGEEVLIDPERYREWIQFTSNP